MITETLNKLHKIYANSLPLDRWHFDNLANELPQKNDKQVEKISTLFNLLYLKPEIPRVVSTHISKSFKLPRILFLL